MKQSVEFLKPDFGDWYDLLEPVIQSEMFSDAVIETEKLYAFGNKIISPPYHLIFRAFKMCPLEKFKCTIVGGEPYPDGKSATGLAFGVDSKRLMALPDSLQNIMNEIEASHPMNLVLDFDISLESWAKQGVLLLSANLTVEAHKPKAHTHIWHPVITAFLDHITAKFPYHPMLVFGELANTVISPYTKQYSQILYSPNPAAARYGSSPGAVGSNVFVHANYILTTPSYQINKPSIDWINEYHEIKDSNDTAPY